MTTATCFIALLLALGYLWSRDHLRLTGERDENDAEWAGECLRLNALKASAERDAETNEAAMKVLAVRLLEARNERDMYETALRGELTRQVNAELLHPEEPVGTATVIDWPVAEVVPLRKGRAK